MPIIIKNATGGDEEVYTKQELEDATKKASEEFTKNNPLQKDLETTRTQLADAEKKLKDAEAGGGSDDQKERLRKERDDALAREKDVLAKLDDVSKKVENFTTSQYQEFRDELVNGVTKDPKIAEKVKLHYDQTLGAMPATNKAEIKARMEAAVQLATGNAPKPGFFDQFGGAAGDRGNPQNFTSEPQQSENDKNMKKLFGITEEDAKKHSGKHIKGTNNPIQ